MTLPLRSLNATSRICNAATSETRGLGTRRVCSTPLTSAAGFDVALPAPIVQSKKVHSPAGRRTFSDWDGGLAAQVGQMIAVLLHIERGDLYRRDVRTDLLLEQAKKALTVLALRSWACK